MSDYLEGKYIEMIDMEEQNEGDSISVVNTILKNEDNFEEERELTSTPLKRYVNIVAKDGNKWICNYGCKAEPYTGTYSRIRAHMIGLLPGQKSQGVALCSKVTKPEREKMKKEEEEAKRIFGGCLRKAHVPGTAVGQQTGKASMNSDKGKDSDTRKIISKEDTDEAVARFFYGNGIPLNVAKSPFWAVMVRAINEAPKGYKPPSSEKIKTTLLDKEKTKVDQELVCRKQQWLTHGVSIVSNGWLNAKKEPFIKVMAVSEQRTMFINGVNCSKDDVSSEYIADVLLKAVESVGAYSVVQILTDDSSICKAAGKIIEAAYPHIFWSGCVAHTLNLLLRDIVKSMDPILEFVAACYSMAKGIMNYLKNHTSSLYIFRTFPELDILRLKKRRYGQHYLVLERVLRVRNALINMVLSEEWEKLKRGMSKSKMDHDGVRKTVLDDEFWKKLKIIVTFTKPIWDVICYCSSANACIGEVYPKVDDMSCCIKVALPDNANVYGVIQGLLDGSWDKTNLPLYSLAYALTPFFYSDNWLTSFAPDGGQRRKPHADPNVHKVYLDVVDRLVRDSKEASVVRQQLSDFVSNGGFFTRPQAIKDRETMSAFSWWHLYGASAPELYSLAIKVLSQCINTTCGERELTTFDYIRNVKNNVMNAGRAESLLYVHFNHRLLTRYREDYEGLYKNWDYFLNDDNLEIDMDAIEDREYAMLTTNEGTALTVQPLNEVTSAVFSQLSTQGSSSPKLDEKVRGKRPRTK